MAEDSGEKTEEPTPHKLREANEKGQVAKSKDLTTALLLIVSFFTLKFTAKTLWENLSVLMNDVFSRIPLPFSQEMALEVLGRALETFLVSMLPFFLVNLVLVLIVESVQTGFVFSLDPLIPKFDKLNPIEGFKKFFSLKQYVELLKSSIKLGITIFIIWGVLKEDFFMVLISQQISIFSVIAFTASLVMKSVIRIGLFYLIIAIFDFFYQRFEFIKSMRMSKKEVKDEYKKLEGDPMVKQRMRDAQRKMAQGRQMGAIPNADVVVTNPTHYAVAIKYLSNNMQAPKVVAKGKRLLALEIKKIAEENFVPIIENKPLAQGLYRFSEVGADIPTQFFRAVAEILAFVYNLKKQKRIRI
jgi:flagellar biosynthetic protein FlhB